MVPRQQTILFVVLLVLCLGCTAWAQNASHQQQNDRFSKEQQIKNWLRNQDEDGDGKVSKDEATGLMKTYFDQNDEDRDGFIDQNELDQLADRLNRNRQPRNRKTMPTEALLKQVPEGLQLIPDIAYRSEYEACKLDLVMLKSKDNQPRPALIFVHGGGWRGGDKRAGGFINPCFEFAAQGYVCVTVNYRLLGEAESIADCIADVKCAVRWLRAHAGEYTIDPNRFGAYGNSAGAHLVSMLGLCPPSAGMEGDGPHQDVSSQVQAVVASATPASFMIPMNDRARSSSFVMDDETRKKISPISYVNQDAPPFLLFHEVSDKTVAVQQSDEFVKALKAAGAKDVTYERYEDGSGHGVFMKNISKTGPLRKAFFDRVLKKAL